MHFSLQKPDNSKDITVGTLIAVLVDEGDDWQNVVIPDHEEITASDTPTDTSPSGQQTADPGKYVLFSVH